MHARATHELGILRRPLALRRTRVTATRAAEGFDGRAAPRDHQNLPLEAGAGEDRATLQAHGTSRCSSGRASSRMPCTTSFAITGAPLALVCVMSFGA